MRIPIGSIWRHTAKNLDYVVVGIAKSAGTLQTQVVYRQMYKSPDLSIPDYGLWVRLKDDFLGETVVNGRRNVRFNYIGETYYE